MSTGNDPIIEVAHLGKTYSTAAGPVPVLFDVQFCVQAGELVAVMGPSGSGKSTFMNILGCLDRASRGEYRLGGRAVDSLSRDELAALRNRDIGFVFQGFNLLARATLEDNVALPLVYAGLGRSERRERARQMLDKVGLGRHARAFPNQISGGQQQRVAIARALANAPDLLLADEPTGALDSQTGKDVLALFHQLNAEGLTIVIVTHDHDVAAQAGRRVTFRDGLIVSDDKGGAA